jgi:hypothetical protein
LPCQTVPNFSRAQPSRSEKKLGEHDLRLKKKFSLKNKYLLAEKLDPPTESLENQKTKNAERPPK